MTEQTIKMVGTFGGVENNTLAQAQSQANSVNTYLDLAKFHATMRIGGPVHGNANELIREYSGLKMENVTGDELKGIAQELVIIHGDGVITDAEVQRIGTMVSDANAVWTMQNNNDGTGSINLGDYTITLNEHEQRFTITNNATAEVMATIWGDPHVDDGDDDSGTDFDFWQDMSINLPGGIRILADTRDSTNSDSITEGDASWTSRLIISNGDETIEVTGLAGSIDGSNNLDIRRISDGSLGYSSTAASTELWLSNDGTFYREASFTNEVTSGEIAFSGGFARPE
jgi:hypothetical protein